MPVTAAHANAFQDSAVQLRELGDRKLTQPSCGVHKQMPEEADVWANPAGGEAK
jgi:hypothetical protein